ncbi:hypothetical protein GH733_014012 [Mirounga leonina]|nr:hypothetical protein GH733_014012 [Mirounga leonina]
MHSVPYSLAVSYLTIRRSPCGSWRAIESPAATVPGKLSSSVRNWPRLSALTQRRSGSRIM